MFAKGDIVKDIAHDSGFYEKQGEVTRTYPNGTITVRFPLFMIPEYLFGWNENKRPITVTYKGEELKDLVLEEHWDESALTVWRAEQIWPNYHHSVYAMKTPFKEGSECMIEGCSEIAIKRGLINAWGTVCPVDMCQNHCEKWDEKAVELLPKLKKHQD